MLMTVVVTDQSYIYKQRQKTRSDHTLNNIEYLRNRSSEDSVCPIK